MSKVKEALNALEENTKQRQLLKEESFKAFFGDYPLIESVQVYREPEYDRYDGYELVFSSIEVEYKEEATEEELIALARSIFTDELIRKTLVSSAECREIFGLDYQNRIKDDTVELDDDEVVELLVNGQWNVIHPCSIQQLWPDLANVFIYIDDPIDGYMIYKAKNYLVENSA